MSNLILGVTPTKRLTHRLYIGLETNWTLKENNQIAKATPPKTIFQNVHTEVFVEPRGQASDKVSCARPLLSTNEHDLASVRVEG